MPIQPPETITTARLILRRPRPEDAEVIFQEYAQDWEVTRYLSWPSHKNVSETRAFLNSCPGRWASGEELSWVITLASEDRAMGMIGCRLSSWMAGIGYCLARRYWNQGFMCEAAGAVVEWALGCQSICRLWAVCHVSNPASARVMEKVGMTREGLLRRWTMCPNLSPQPQDCFIYARTR
jgi:[ribosomal protein S5]-alanine N-acetyltransferase